MKKVKYSAFFALVVVLVVVGVMALQWSTGRLWKPVGAITTISGGACYLHAELLQCDGGAIMCEDKPCNNAGVCAPFGYELGFPHRRLKFREREYYFPSVKTVESNGRSTYTMQKVTCYKKIECSATGCVQGDKSGEFFCSQSSSSNVEVDNYPLSGDGC